MPQCKSGSRSMFSRVVGPLLHPSFEVRHDPNTQRPSIVDALLIAELKENGDAAFISYDRDGVYRLLVVLYPRFKQDAHWGIVRLSAVEAMLEIHNSHLSCQEMLTGFVLVRFAAKADFLVWSMEMPVSLLVEQNVVDVSSSILPGIDPWLIDVMDLWHSRNKRAPPRCVFNLPNRLFFNNGYNTNRLREPEFEGKRDLNLVF